MCYIGTAMSAVRLSLMSAFAGGCLCSAVVFGLWQVAEGASASEAKQPRRSQRAVAVATAATAAPLVVDSPPPPAVSVATEPAHAGKAEPATSEASAALDNSGPAPAGSAVSDILMGLEAAYRARVGARAEPAPVPAASAIAAVEPAPAAVAPPLAAPPIAAPPVAPVVPVAVPVAVAAPPDVRTAALAPAAVAPLPAYAAPSAPAPSTVHYGDVNQNTYITNVRQGDLYLIQMQQLAMLQYMQMMGASSGIAAPPRFVGGGGGHQRFPSGITNPDNPWGFQFSPPNLVR